MDNNLKGNPSAINYGGGFMPRGLKMSKVRATNRRVAKGPKSLLKPNKRKRTAVKMPKNMSGQYGQKRKIK